MSDENNETLYDDSLVKRNKAGQPIRPKPPLLSQTNKDLSGVYAKEKEAFDVASAEWERDQVPDDNSSLSFVDSDDLFNQSELATIFASGRKATTELEENAAEVNEARQSVFDRWIAEPLKVRKEKQEAVKGVKHQQDIEALVNARDEIVFGPESNGTRSYTVTIPTIGLLTGNIPSNVGVSDVEAIKAVVIEDFKNKYISEVNVIPPIDLSSDVVKEQYMTQMRKINDDAYEINKPAILKNEGLFGRLGDLASRDRADKSYKNQFKELVPDTMKQAFLVRRVTVGVYGIDQKTIAAKDLPDYYKDQIKSIQSQLVGIGNASGGTQVADKAELEAQIEDCKVMERGWRIIVDAAYDPRMNSAQFLDMQKSGMETISKQMTAAGARLTAFKNGITKKNAAAGVGVTATLATAGYFMYGWINSGAATANAISDLAAIEAWFNGAGSTIGSGFTSAGSAISSWGVGAGATMGSWGASAFSWMTGTGLTMETGLISAGLLTAGGALTATGIGAVVVLGVGLLVVIDFAFNEGKISKAAAKGLVDFCKGTVALVKQVNADQAKNRMLTGILTYEQNGSDKTNLTQDEANNLAAKLENALVLSEIVEELKDPGENVFEYKHLRKIIALKIQGEKLDDGEASQFQQYLEEGDKGLIKYADEHIRPAMETRAQAILETEDSRVLALGDIGKKRETGNTAVQNLNFLGVEALQGFKQDVSQAQAELVDCVRQQFKAGKKHHMSGKSHGFAMDIINNAEVAKVVLDNAIDAAGLTKVEQLKVTGTSVRQGVFGLNLEEAKAQHEQLKRKKEALSNSLPSDTDSEEYKAIAEQREVLNVKLDAAEKLVSKLQAKANAPSFYQSVKERFKRRGDEAKGLSDDTSSTLSTDSSENESFSEQVSSNTKPEAEHSEGLVERLLNFVGYKHQHQEVVQRGDPTGLTEYKAWRVEKDKFAEEIRSAPSNRNHQEAYKLCNEQLKQAITKAFKQDIAAQVIELEFGLDKARDNVATIAKTPTLNEPDLVAAQKELLDLESSLEELISPRNPTNSVNL